MAVQLYTKGGAIVIDGFPESGDIQIINPSKFDWKIDRLTGVYTLRDGISGQDYKIGIYTDISNIDGVVFASDEKLQLALNQLINRTDVSIQDQTSEIIDLHFTKLINVITLVNNLAIDQRTFQITSASLPVVGQMICLKENIHFYQGELISVALVSGNTYNITVDSPVDYAFTTLGGCSLRSSQLNVDGSVTSQIFTISPQNTNTKWHIQEIYMSLRSTTDMDNSKFGGIPALQKGIILRYKNNTYKNIFNAKTNGDLALHAYIQYDTKAPAGQYGLRVEKDIKGRHGTVLYLDSETMDELQIIVQDNLTALAAFEAVAQGHIVTD